MARFLRDSKRLASSSPLLCTSTSRGSAAGTSCTYTRSSCSRLSSTWPAASSAVSPALRRGRGALHDGRAGIGLVYCAASLWQMLRGSVVIFAAIISVLMKQPQRSYRWIAVFITFTGICIAGLTGVLSAGARSSEGYPALGCSPLRLTYIILAIHRRRRTRTWRAS